MIEEARCLKCGKCIRETGCPALYKKDSAVIIDTSLCTGCGLCSKVCPADCIARIER